MAAAVEMREPLVPLYPRNSQDSVFQSPPLGKQSQRPKVIGKSASIGASRSFSGAKAEPIKPAPAVENFISRASADLTTQRAKPAVDISQQQSRPMEEQGESGITSLSTGGQRDDGEIEVDAGDEQESQSLMRMKMEAMTWAAMAKDYEISSLERRLRQALEIAKAEQERNQQLGRLLRESREREAAAALELEDANEQIRQLIDAEERLCVQLGDLEVEAIEEGRRYPSQIAALTARIEEQDKFIAEALKPFKTGQLAAQQLKLLSYVQTSEFKSLTEDLEKAEEEISALQAELSEAKRELQITEGLKKSQSRRLKALEKERRYLMRKGAIRSVRLAPRNQKTSETEAPGGEGWKVFSILDFQT